MMAALHRAAVPEPPITAGTSAEFRSVRDWATRLDSLPTAVIAPKAALGGAL